GMALAMSLSASAEWKVQDKKLREIGSDDYKDTNDGEKQGKFNKPDVKFEAKDNHIDQASLTGKKPVLSAIDSPINERCREPTLPGGAVGAAAQKELDKLISSATGGRAMSLSAKKWQVCKEIVETQQARFAYNVVMSELAEKRYERLKEIREERGNIGSDEAGKLEENNNRMLALIAAVQIDQQQRAAYNDIYDARLVYLEGLQQRLTQQTLDGKPNPVVEGAAMVGMAAALGVSPDRVLP
ncbi:MAG: hypothetical protein Q4G62_00395, partial [Pseudomonadota bacterium]|nr:hypothetical protein [Pseudomonadota bacterium]